MPAVLNGRETERGVCDIGVARVCADARHTNDTHSFPQTTLFVVSKSRLIASSARHLLVTEKKTYPPLRSPPFKKVPDKMPAIRTPSAVWPAMGAPTVPNRWRCGSSDANH